MTGVDPHVEMMEVTDWLHRIEQEPRRTRCKFVYQKVFGYSCLNDKKYSYWDSFLEGNNITLSSTIRLRRGIKNIETTKDTLHIGNKRVTVETLMI